MSINPTSNLSICQSIHYLTPDVNNWSSLMDKDNLHDKNEIDLEDSKNYKYM